MTNFLLKVCDGYLELCLTGTMVLCIVLLIRALAKNHVPKKYVWILWLAVFFRLLCLITVEGPIPDFWSGRETSEMQVSGDFTEFSQQVEQAGPEPVQIGNAGNGFAGEGYAQIGDRIEADANVAPNANPNGNPYEAANGEQNSVQDGRGETATGDMATERFSRTDGIKLITATTVLAGMAFFLAFEMGKYVQMYFCLRTAVRIQVRKGEDFLTVWECEGVTSPMVFGIVKPRIYLPLHFAEQVEEQELQLILEHEQAHIKRGDFVWKALSLLALAVHWWNPLVWLAVKLFVKDMEMACDESVLAGRDEDLRTNYAKALLHFSMRQSGLFAMVAFGESNTESRVKNILKYHKRTVVVSGVMLAVALVLVLCLVTKPHEIEQNQGAENQTGQEMETKPGVSDAEGNETDSELESEAEAEVQPSAETQTPEEPLTLAQAARENFVKPDPEELQHATLISSQFGEYDYLFDPVTSVERLLDLQGGTGEYLRDMSYNTGERGYVTYTFEDGSRLVYSVSNGKEYGLLVENMWFPTYVLREESAESILRETMETIAYLERTTAERLREIEEVEFELMNRGGVQDEFYLLEEDSDEDIALYGLAGGSGMILRRGDSCYPFYHRWDSQYGTPDMYTGDYDEDGQLEVAIITDQGGGLGVYLEYLYVLEITDKGLEIYKFDDARVCEQINRVDFEWDEESKTLQAIADGENVGPKVSMQEVLEERQMEGLDIGQQMSFVCREGQWYVMIGGGVLTEGHATAQYDIFTLIIETPVYYTGEGFETGEITISYRY